MATYEITSPDGKVFEVTAPEGATQEQVLSYAKSQWAAKPEQPKGKLEQFKDMLLSSRNSPIAGGPIGMIASQGMKKIDEATNRVAYGAGGKVTDALAGNVSPEVAAGAGYLTNLGTQLGASYLTGKVFGAAGKPTMERAAKRTMQAAIKPTLPELESGKATKAIETLLKEDVGPTQGGILKLRAEISKLEDEIEKAISGSGAMINKGEVGKRLKDSLEQFKMQVNPGADMEAVRKAWLEFRNHPLLVGKTEMPIELAQSMKRGTYRMLDGKAYGEMKGAETEAQKALARGLKEEIAKAVPAVGPMNARQGELLNAVKVANRRALMDSNKNVLGLGPIAPNTASMLAFLADRSPALASYLARVMYQNAEVLPGGAAALASTPILMRSGQAPQEPALLRR